MISENRTKQVDLGDARRILETDKDDTCVASWLVSVRLFRNPFARFPLVVSHSRNISPSPSKVSNLSTVFAE
jgi:hypothetical protein